MAYTVTSCAATLTVTADTACVPNLLLTAGNAVLAEVLSGGVNYTITDTNATPGKNDHGLTVGDQVFVDPAKNLRMVRASADSCVKLTAFQGSA